MKPPTACLQCRISKRRCTRPNQGDCCAQCHRRGLKCGSTDVGPDNARPRERVVSNRSTPVIADPSRVSDMHRQVVDRLSNDLLHELAEMYLDKVHGRAHSIFHPATVRLQLRNGELSKHMLYAMSSIGSKFSLNPEHRHVGIPLSKEAQRLLQADMNNTCIENIQTCILCAMLCAGIAINMAEFVTFESILDERQPLSVRETARRVSWALFLAHHRCFSGLGLEMSSYHLPPNVDLPMDDLVFASLEPGQMQPEVFSPSKPGLWAHMMTLTKLSGLPIELNRQIATSAIKSDELSTTVFRVRQQFEGWLESIPSDAHMNIQNLYRHQQNGLGGLLVALHLTYHYNSILLYFSFLERRDALPSICTTSIGLCKHHATSFSSLLHISRQLDGCSISYPGVGHMITVCSAVLVHTLLLGDAGEIQDARRDLNANFQALVDLLEHWPATSAVIGRLMKFQDTCLLSTESHRVDGWVVRFLLDHSVGLEDRNMAKETSAAHNYGVNEEESIKTKQLKDSGRYTDFGSIQGEGYGA